ncbi:MAG: hypothetical protein ABNH42_19690 [Marinobacter sp.]|jgi:hypothetical protein
MRVLDQIAARDDVFRSMMGTHQPGESETHNSWKSGRMSGALFIMFLNDRVSALELAAAERELWELFQGVQS